MNVPVVIQCLDLMKGNVVYFVLMAILNVHLFNKEMSPVVN